MFPELVEKFNQNKLYNQIPDMKQHDISRFVEFEDDVDYYSMVVNERENYLSRHGIAIWVLLCYWLHFGSKKFGRDRDKHKLWRIWIIKHTNVYHETPQ